MLKRKSLLITVLCTMLAFTACSNTPNKVVQLNTEAAATAAEIITQTAAAITPTDTAVPPTETPNYTATPIILPTILRYAETVAIATVVSGQPATGLYNGGELIGFSPASNIQVTPKQAFYLSVQIKNTGTTYWNTSYKIIHSGGTQMSYATSYPLTGDVASGGTYTASIYMTAPENYGTYTQTWTLVDAYNATVLTFSYNVIVGTTSIITSVPTLTPTITLTSQATAYSSQLDYMCSDAARSIEQGQGCEDYCKIANPYKSPCYYRGTINPTATNVPSATLQPTKTYTTAPTAAPTSTPIPISTTVPPPDTAVPTEETPLQQDGSADQNT